MASFASIGNSAGDSGLPHPVLRTHADPRWPVHALPSPHNHLHHRIHPSMTSSIDLYNASMANVKGAAPGIAQTLERTACEATARSLKGRVVLVTGAGSGFGRAFSLSAASHGWGPFPNVNGLPC